MFSLQVLCALSFYATGSYQRLVGEGKYLGQTTVSKYVREVTDALTTPGLINYFIKFPITRSQRDLMKKKYVMAIFLLYVIINNLICVF